MKKEAKTFAGFVGVVTGLTAEARLAAPLGVARAGGGTPAGAARAAASLIAEGATALVSFGLAGGLNPGLPPGTLIIPARLVTACDLHHTDTVLTCALGGPVHTLYAGASIAATAAQKANLFATTGADAIDLESGAVAEIAAAHGIPFAILRAICDPADSMLPPAAIIALDAGGAIALGRVAASILRNPSQVAALLRLARQAASARAALRQRVREIGQVKSE